MASIQERAETKTSDSVSSFEYVSADPDHLAPITLSRVAPEIRRRKAGLMFFVPFIAATIIPFIPLMFAGTSYLGNPDIPPGCPDPNASDGYSFLNFLEIGSITWGEFSFATVKFIDIAWDVIVGRGGQALMVFICYKVHLGGLVHIMESSPVSYELYTVLTFAGGSITTLIALVKRIFSTRRYLARMIWLFLSTIYVVLFPTLMAAMTGYVSFPETWIVLKGGGGLVTYDDFQNELNIGNNTWGRLMYDGIEYNMFNYLSNNTCFTRNTNRYKYGMSTDMWLIVSVSQAIWVFGTYGLWVDSNRKSQLNQAGRNIGTYRAVIDLGGALAEDLGPETCAYSEKGLEKRLSKRGLGLKYYQSSGGAAQYIGLSSGKHEGQIDLDIARNIPFGSKIPSKSLGGRGVV